jgi:light-regulated signal transduction histidine kinase (bacteriophytochrome)
VSAVDLTNCDREPIHVPGAIQPGGVLLALHPETERVLCASANAGELLDVDGPDLVGRGLADVLGEEAAASLRARLAARPPRGDHNPLAVAGVAGRDGRPLHVLAHDHDGATILEFEPAEPGGDDGLTILAQLIREATGRLQRATSVVELSQALAEEVRALTGFDRVMVYRFDEDWAGDVIAEALGDGLDPYLGLHYPASDIPAQARRLYHLNWTRAIPDATYRPVPLVPERRPDTGRALDLSFAALRSVSPIHLEYLANMGSTATLTISLLRGDRLWGLISCHHHSGPMALPAPLRAATEFLGQFVSLTVSTRADSDEVALVVRTREALARVTGALTAAGEALADALVAQQDALLELGRAGGAVLRLEGRTAGLGDVPDDLDGLLDDLLERAGDEPVLAVDDRGPGVASGALLIRIGRRSGDALALLRPERRRTVDWAGDPRKPVTVDPLVGEQRLHPRGSFALWQETVSGRSLPWHPVEVAAAQELRRAIQDVVLRHAEELAVLNAELERSNAELDEFAHIASHDLREPLRGLSTSAHFLLEDHADELSPDAVRRLRTLTRLTARMEDLVESLLHVSQAGRLELAVGEVPLTDVWAEVAELLGPRAEAAGVQLRTDGELPVVVADRVRLREVLANLASNAIKYRDEAAQDSWVALGVRHRPTPSAPDVPQLCLVVSDNGIGIRANHLETVFRLFKRLHRQGERGGGTGAGLTIVRKLVELHGGEVWAESEPGGGAAFWFTLGPPGHG